jgi:hypothetical protein
VPSPPVELPVPPLGSGITIEPPTPGSVPVPPVPLVPLLPPLLEAGAQPSGVSLSNPLQTKPAGQTPSM